MHRNAETGPAAYVEEFHRRISGRFARAEPRRRALTYLCALLEPVGRRNGWQIADVSGESYPDGMQRLLSSARWDADLVRDDLRDFVVESAGDPQGILVLDEWQFPKKGERSVGVERQFSPQLRRVENCQTGLFLSYVTARGRFLLDRELYLPPSWARDLHRRHSAGIPDDIPFQPKWQRAWTMAERALAGHVPCRWVAVPGRYDRGSSVRALLESTPVQYVLGIRLDERLPVAVDRQVVELPAESAARLVPSNAWVYRPDRGPRRRGARPSLWARIPVATRQPSLAVRWLLLRRGWGDPRDVRAYLCSADRSCTLPELICVTAAMDGNRRFLAAACDQVGLDQYEVRQWTAWYRYLTLALAAHACLVLADADAGADPLATAAAGRSMPPPVRCATRPAPGARVRRGTGHRDPRADHGAGRR